VKTIRVILGGVSLGLSLLTPAQTVALDFHLREHRVPNIDGDSFDFYFAHNESKLFYRPPWSWTWQGTNEEFVARPPLPSRGRLVLQAMKPYPALPAPGTTEGLEAYRKHFTTTLPSGSSNGEEIELVVDKIGGHELPATRGTFHYEWGGRARGQMVIYAEFRPDLWLVIRVDSLKEDFDQVKKVALASLEGLTEGVQN
jgi:hypothetical protein